MSVMARPDPFRPLATGARRDGEKRGPIMSTTTVRRVAGTIVRTHIDGTPDVLRVLSAEEAERWTRIVRASNGDHGSWAAVPPSGSDWEQADWDAAAHRCGVA